MHILLTDFLRCPRCGPNFGLILLADRMEDRRVIEGSLGCPNCRRSYPIRAGVADLRHPESPPLVIQALEISNIEEAVLRVAALIGAQPANAKVLLLGGGTDIAGRLTVIFPEAHIVTGSPDADTATDSRHWNHLPHPRAGQTSPEQPLQDAGKDPTAAGERAATLSRTLHDARLPFASGSFTAVAVIGSPSSGLLPELARVLRPGGRLVVEGAAPDLLARLRDGGFDVHLSQDDTVVAAVRGPR